MSMQLGLGIVGAAVGFMFGVPQLGFIVGSMLGAALTKGPDTQGPKLSDQRVSASTYGAGLATVYGTRRTAGNVIWSTDKQQVATTTSQGKGGDSGSQTTYSYFVNMAIGLCNGPISGIRKIWQNGQLIYDQSQGISLASALASAAAANGTATGSTVTPIGGVTIYPGDEAQLPDPTMEANDGAGNVPAYRGLAYVVLSRVQCPGGSVPQFSFEVSNSLSSAPSIMLITTAPVQVGYGGVCTSEGSVHFYSDPSNGLVNVFSCGNGYANRTMTVSLPSYGLTWYCRPVMGTAPSPKALRPASDLFNIFIDVIDLINGSVTTIAQFSQGSTSINNKGGAAYDPISGKYAVLLDTSVTSPTPIILNSGVATVCAALAGKGAPLAFYNNALYALSNLSSVLSFVTFDGTTGAITSSIAAPAGVWYTESCAIQADAGGIYLFLNGVPNATHASIYKLSGSSWVLVSDGVKQWVGQSGLGGIQSVNPSFLADDRHAVTGPHVDNSYYFSLFATYSPVLLPVANVITDQCSRAGIGSGQIDVSTLTDTVWGYTVTNPASARANLQPLLTANAIDAAEEDGKIKFFKRAAIVSVASVSYDELAVVENSGTPGDPLPLTRAQEVDLPRSVAISYINPSFDYQTGTEIAQRQVTSSALDQTLDLPIATDANSAAKIAQIALYDAWNERNARTAQVSRKFVFVSPGDGVTIEYPQGINTLWRVTKCTDTGTLLQWSVVPADASIYTQPAIAGGTGTAGAGQTVAALPPPTQMQIIDGPILQDADDNPGPYVALAGVASGYPGGSLYSGNDVNSMQPRGAVQNEAVMGYAETALGNWSAGTVDETNLVTVNVGHFTLNACTRDAMLNNGVNVAAIGANGRWEIIQFYIVNSLGGGRYILSGLLRGRRGSDWATGLHQANDRFVMLALAGTLRPATSYGEIGLLKTYEAVTIGRDMTSAVSAQYANTAEGLKPYSPTVPRWSKDASNNVTITWARRTRYSENWLMGIVPLGESSEAYSIDLFTSGAFTTLAGTVTSSTNSVTLTSAQQTAMGLTPGAKPFPMIYQLSSTIGRGHALQAVL